VGREHCGKAVVPHTTENAPCARFWWQDEDAGSGEQLLGRLHRYSLACGGSYTALSRPEGAEIRTMAGIMARFPLQIEVITDPLGGVHQATIERIKRATDLTIREVNE
jgi:hypothetical protein